MQEATRFSAAIRRGLIEASFVEGFLESRHEFSAAIRRGLIEAHLLWHPSSFGLHFPRRFAAASLKHYPPLPNNTVTWLFSAAIRRGLIEAWKKFDAVVCIDDFPRRFAAASLKRGYRHRPVIELPNFPRRFAAASLKRLRD